MHILDDRAGWAHTFAIGWLASYQATGKPDWKIYNRPSNATKVSGAGIRLSHSRVVLISSAGGYLPASQARFDAENDLGDYSIRLIPVTTLLGDIAFAHTHYDHTAVEADPQVLVPLNHMDTFVAEGGLGELAPNMISFMGYQPDVTRLLDETIPAIVAAAKAQGAHGALLVPS